MKFYLFTNFLTSLLTPLSVTLISTIIIYTLTHDVSIDKYVFVIIGICVVTFALEALNHYSFTHYEWENTFVRVTAFWIRLAKHQIEIDYPNIEPKEKQKKTQKAFEAISSNWVGIEHMLKRAPVLVFNIVGLIFYGVLISIYVPQVLPVLIIMSIVNFFLTKRANKYFESKREEVNDEWSEKYYLSRTVTDLTNGKDIRIYRLDKWFNKLFALLTKKVTFLRKGINRKYMFAEVSNTIFLFIRDAISYYIIIMMIIDGKINVATLTFLIGIVAGFSSWLNGFMSSFNDLRRANILINEYRDCLDTKNVFLHEEGKSIKNIKLPIEIEFKDVSFTYPDSDKPTINNLSFKIKAGEKLALVGENGSGKTTIVKLLCGLYKPTKGKIYINKEDLSNLNIDEYMDLLSVCFQDSEPLALSVLQNVTCSKEKEVDIDKFWEALEDAGLKEKILSLDNKENTYITQVFDESGVRFSGGEIQKLMLARALYKNAPLLILDEPTASLDPISEEKMYLTYESFSKGNTSLFISHRLSSTKFCNRILFLENGKIVEEGTHEELISKGGKYKEIFDIQSKYYREDSNE
jgi:ATP-binding cassette subfamily B protein